MTEEQFHKFFQRSEHFLPNEKTSKNLVMQLLNEKTEFNSFLLSLTEHEEDNFMNLEVG